MEARYNAFKIESSVKVSNRTDMYLLGAQSTNHTKVSLREKHVLSKYPKERRSPPWNIIFQCFQGGDGHLLRKWRTGNMPYAEVNK